MHLITHLIKTPIFHVTRGTPDISNEFKAISNGYDNLLEREDYARIDVVTARANHWHNERIYTLNDKREVGIYSMSGGSQEDVKVLTRHLTKASQQIIEAPNLEPIVRN